MSEDRQTRLHGLLESQQWDAAWAEYERLAQEGPPGALLSLRGSHAAYGRRDFFRARHLVDEALLLYSPTSDPSRLLGQIRFHLGMVARRVGDSHVALEQFQTFLDELPNRYPDLHMGEGRAWYYLGLTMRERRDYEGSKAAYRRAIDWHRSENMNVMLCVCLHNLSWLLLMEDQDTTEPRRLLEESAHLLSTDELRTHQILGEALLAYRDGYPGQASDLCQAVFRMADRGQHVSLEERSQAAWIAGMVAKDQGFLEQASALAEVALGFATEARESRLMNDANNLRRSIYLAKQTGA